MKILFLCSAKKWGGNEKWTLLAAHSISKKHNVIIGYRNEIIGDRCYIEKIKLPFFNEIDPITIGKLIKVIKKEKIDIIIPTKRKEYVIAGILSRICHIKNIIRLGIDRPLTNTLLHRLIYQKMCDGIITNAKKTKTTLVESPWLDSTKIAVIYNGLDKEKVIKQAKTHYIPPYPFIILSAGALIPRKGFDFLIRSFALFKKRNQQANVGLIIIGTGPLLNSLKELAKSLTIDKYVHFTGFITNPYPIMKASNIYITASQSEGISNALLESILLGCVPISTYSGGAEEIIQNNENGFLIEYNNDEKLSLIIEKLYSNKELRENIIMSAKNMVENNFSIERMTIEITTFCQSIISKKHQ